MGFIGNADAGSGDVAGIASTTFPAASASFAPFYSAYRNGSIKSAPKRIKKRNSFI